MKTLKEKIIEILSKLEGGMVEIYNKEGVASQILELFEEDRKKLAGEIEKHIKNCEAGKKVCHRKIRELLK